MAKLISGQITVAAAGTEVSGPASVKGIYYLSPHPANVGAYVYVGDDGSGAVSNATGFVLGKGEKLILPVTSLDQLLFDVDQGGDKVCWLLAEDRSTVGGGLSAV